VYERTRNGDSLGKAARLVCAEQHSSSTQLGFATETQLACPAGDQRIDRDTTTVVRGTDELVSHDEGRYSKAWARDPVKLTPTYTGTLNVHDDLVFPWDDVVNVFHFHDA
jgi:hypothetical protein